MVSATSLLCKRIYCIIWGGEVLTNSNSTSGALYGNYLCGKIPTRFTQLPYYNRSVVQGALPNLKLAVMLVGASPTPRLGTVVKSCQPFKIATPPRPGLRGMLALRPLL